MAARGRCFGWSAVAVVAAVVLVAAAAPCWAEELKDDGDMTMNQLTLNSEKGTAKLQLGRGREKYTLGVDHAGFFVHHQDRNVFRIGNNGHIHADTNLFAANAFAAGNLALGGVHQWRMAALELFHGTVKPTDAGWDTDITHTCKSSSISMLVGPHGRDLNPKKPAMKKTYTNLPSHDQIRVTGTGHFVDDWQGEVAYLQINGHYVWTESHDQRSLVSTFDVCGEHYPESKFAVNFDITLPHHESSFTFAAGSTLEPGAPAFFGISSLSVLVRHRSVPPSPALDSAAANATAAANVTAPAAL